MEVPPEVRYAVREGKSIAFQRFGSGERRLLWIPTSVGNLDLSWAEGAICDMWVHHAERAECVLYDQLGTGLSDPVDHVPTIEERAADLGAVMDAAGFASATICAAYDACLGAVLFAAQRPERVDGMVLLGPFGQGWLGAVLCVIHGPTAGRRWEASAARKQLHHAASAAGVRRRFAPHQLRHAHAVEMAHEGFRWS